MRANVLKTATLSLGVLMLGVTGCSDSDNPVASNPAPAQVLIVHASPDAPGVDIFVDNGQPAAVSNLQFLSNTGYVPVPAGVRNVRVKLNATTDTVINANLTLVSGTYYSVFAVDSASKVTALVLEDDLTAPAAGKAHLRFVHLSPNAPNVDIALTGGGVIGGLGNVPFKEARGFLPLGAGTYDLEVRVAGTSNVALPLPGITLEAGKIYTVYAKGFLGGANAQALGAAIIVNRN
jgi:hypothetical protein